MYNSKTEIKKWLNQMRIKNYIIDDNLIVYVNKGVNLSNCNLKKIPVKFGIVKGYFDCSNNELTSLKGCPQIISGSFICKNNNLTSLEYCPKEIKNDFDCSNNKLINFKYFPLSIECEFFSIKNNNIAEDELINFKSDINNVKRLNSDFGIDKDDFLEKVNYYKSIKNEMNCLKKTIIKISINKLNKKL